MRLINKQNLAQNNKVTTAVTGVIDLREALLFSNHAQVDVNTPSAALSAAAAVSTANDTITKTGHDFTTGLKGQFTTSGGLPAGLAAVTDYFIIVVDANTYKVATSLVNALAGTAVDITTQGTGNHTFTPTPIAGGAIKLQKSNVANVLLPDYVYASADWEDVAASTAITADGTVFFEVEEPAYLAAIFHLTMTAGRISVQNNLIVKAN